MSDPQGVIFLRSITLFNYFVLKIFQQCSQPCGYPANLGLFFVEFRVFLSFWTCGLLVLIEICLFFADFCFEDCFFSNFMALLLFQSTTEGMLGVFL